MFSKKRYLQSRISGLDKAIGAISREIRLLERERRKEQKLALARSPVRGGADDAARREEDDRRRLASYLSTGSFQTIAQHKFRSDLVRRRRLLVGGGIVILLAAAFIIWRAVT
ncbi:MAG: hypothetical protein V1789_09295 [PVC group bacterium]